MDCKEKKQLFSQFEVFSDILPTPFYWLGIEQQYIAVNASTIKAVGASSFEKDFANKTPRDLYPAKMAEEIIAHHKEVIVASKVMHFEESIKDVATGETKHFIATIAPLRSSGGEVVGTCGISIEITQEKRLKKQLERANAIKSEFIANMNHDLSMPIAGISGMLDGLLFAAEDARSALSDGCARPMEVLEKLTNQVQEYTTIAKHSISELAHLFKAIMETTQLETGRTCEHSEHFDVRLSIQRNINMLRAVATHKQLALTLTVAEDVPRYLYGLRVHLDRTITNLVSNALKFTSKGSVNVDVSLSQSSLEKDVQNDGIQLFIQISDTGIGIADNQFEKIFERFHRSTSSYKGLYKGAGLGLYAVRHYVKKMSGELSFTSRVGEGSCFSLSLPFGVTEHADRRPALDRIENFTGETEPLTPTLADNVGMHILLVEDDAITAMATQLLLKRFGCSIDYACTGGEAIEKMRDASIHYHLILMDIGLPDCDGIEVTWRIRALPDKKRAQTPIVALTGHAGSVDRRQACLDAGAQEVISKPIQFASLRALLQRFRTFALSD